MRFEDIVNSVVDKLSYYEKGFTRVKRTPVEYGIRPDTLSQFIECRINFEAFKDPYLRKYEELMDGYLFLVKSIDGERRGNKFDSITIEVNDNIPLSGEDLESMKEEIMRYVGGTRFTFNSDKKNVELNIIE